LIRTLEDPIFAYGSAAFNLIIQNNGKRLELGPCSIVPETRDDEYTGRLIFLADVYDMHSLLFEDKIVKLQGSFCDLPAVLARKDIIQPPFKEFTANLTYDLTVYKNLFDHLDSKYQEEPETIRDSVQKAVIKTEGQKFKLFLDANLNELELLVADFNQGEHQRHGYYFRKQVWNFILCSTFMTRTNLKPRGYSGDSEMMRMVYFNNYQGNSTFEKLMHKYPLEQPGAQSVRNRRKIILEALNKFKNMIHISPQRKIKILSVASGPAIEIEDILAFPENFDKYHFTLLDQDRLALNEAADLIHGIEKKSDAKVQVDYVAASVRSMIANKRFKRELGTFHFIYSMGLFDYLTQRVGNAVLKSLYQLLKPGGKIIIGNFHESNQSRCFLDYWLDWHLIHRTEAEFLDLLKDISAVETSVFFENTGNQMFLQIVKQTDT
jgi:extracellular factor (EF) 3-hydroxypalmitic acid methyl ester biosynthesis protein